MPYQDSLPLVTGEAVMSARTPPAFSDASRQAMADLLNASPDVIFVLDRADCFVFVGAVAAQALERTPAEMRDHTGTDLHLPSGFVALVQSTLAQVFSDDQPRYGEMTLAGLEGLHRYEASYSPVRDAEGAVQGVLCVARDVTEHRRLQEVLWQSAYDQCRRQEEAEAAILALNQALQRSVVESSHRIKNGLQIMSAITDMIADAAGESVPVDQVRHIGVQIRTLSILHDLLTVVAKRDGTTSSLSVKGLLGRVLQVLQQAAPQVLIHGAIEDATVNMKVGTALALIVNELIANGAKHGGTAVDVAFGVSGDTARLEVADNGLGFPSDFDPVKAAHTGLELIESICRHDLRGKMAYLNRPEGGAWVVLTFPLVSG